MKGLNMPKAQRKTMREAVQPQDVHQNGAATTVGMEGPPMAEPREHTYQPRHLEVQLLRAEERENLHGLLTYLDERGERVRGSNDPDAAPGRRVTNYADAGRWLLQNLHRIRLMQ